LQTQCRYLDLQAALPEIAGNSAHSLQFSGKYREPRGTGLTGRRP
jgi:hypothetical protein